MVYVAHKKKFWFSNDKLFKKLESAERNYLAWTSRDVKQKQKASIKRGAPTTLQREKLKSDDPKVRKRAQMAVKAQAAKRSQENGPPLYRSNDSQIRQIWNVYDPKTNRGVAGMVGLNHRYDPPVPQLLEFGGSVRRLVWTSTGLTAGRFRRASVQSRLLKSGALKWRTLRYGKRPSAGPALEKAAPRFPKIYARAFAGA